MPKDNEVTEAIKDEVLKKMQKAIDQANAEELFLVKFQVFKEVVEWLICLPILPITRIIEAIKE